LVWVTISLLVRVSNSATLSRPSRRQRVFTPASTLSLRAALQSEVEAGRAVRPVGQLVQRRRFEAASGRGVHVHAFGQPRTSARRPAASRIAHAPLSSGLVPTM
jgi:hypothetical protein